jgi:peptide/nickel transport system permease protein
MNLRRCDLDTPSKAYDTSDPVRELGVKRSQWRDIWKRLTRNKTAMLGLFLVVFIVLTVAFANVIAPFRYDGINPTERFIFPNAAHPFGTDEFGRDIFSRVLYGGRVSLIVAILSVLIALVAGGMLGALAGYFGGKTETFIMRAMDILMAVPGFLLAVSISAALGSGLANTAFAVAVGSIPSYARIMCATVLTLKNQEFVEAAVATGGSHLYIIFRHILPNTLSPIIVQSTLLIGAGIMQISSLSFIGLGVRPPTPEWGSIMSSGLKYIRQFYAIITFPGIAIIMTIFGFNLLGDGFRDALDPRLKR